MVEFSVGKLDDSKKSPIQIEWSCVPGNARHPLASKCGTHDELIRKEGLYKKFTEIREQAEGWRIETK